MTFASDLRPALDAARGIAGGLGLHTFTVSVRVRTWSGARVGVGNATTTDTALTVSGQAPKVVPVSPRDAVASGGLYTSQDLRVGPLTPGLTAYATINPATSASPTEVLFVVTGPGTSASGDLYERVGEETGSALHYHLILRSKGVAA